MKNRNHSLFCILTIVCCLVTVSCKERTMEKIVISDGSANTYIITENILEYIPVTPEISSSGVYSGGDPYTKKITKQDFLIITKLVREIFENKNGILQERVMGSIQITRVNSQSKETIIVKSTSKEVMRLQKTLGIVQ